MAMLKRWCAVRATRQGGIAMRTIQITAMMALFGAFTLVVEGGFVPPTWKQLEEAADDATKLPALIKGALPSQAAIVLVRAFDAVAIKYPLNDNAMHRAQVARLTAHAVVAMGDRAIVMAQYLAENSSPLQMPRVAAVYSILLGSETPGLVDALTTKLNPTYVAQIHSAIQQPALVVSPALVIDISSAGGPPAILGGEPSAQPLSPPLVSQGQGGSAVVQPPVSVRYPGQ